MSAIAGRVLIIPQGAYNANQEYHLLDAVFFNGSTYIAKDTTTGNPPSDTEHWQILAQGAQDAAAAVFYGTCITAGSSQNKEVSVEVADNFALKRGAIVGVKFTNTNTFVASAANHITLNVNSSGVYSIYFGADADPEGTNPVAFGEAGFTNYYQFDGTYWTYVGRSGVQTAEETPYDGTSSGLASDNVNDAIDEAFKVNGDQINAIVNVYSAKNYVASDFATFVNGGVTFTRNSDNSYTITTNGSASTGTTANVCTAFTLKKGTYIASFAKDSDDAFGNNVALRLMNATTSTEICSSGLTKAQRTFTLAEDTSVVFKVYVQHGWIVPTQTFYPMIRDARITDPTWASFAMTNKELTEKKISLDTVKNITLGQAFQISKPAILLVSVGNRDAQMQSVGVYITDNTTSGVTAIVGVAGGYSSTNLVWVLDTSTGGNYTITEAGANSDLQSAQLVY